MGSREPVPVEVALLGLCSVVRGLLAGASRDEVLTRQRAGDVLGRAKKAPQKYGTRYVERVAEELGCGTRFLYQHIAVAERWSTESLKVQLERTNRFGQPLSWSHFVALTRTKDASSCAALLDECLDGCWSVRELERQIDAHFASSADSGDAARSGEGVRAALRESIQTGSRAVADLRLMNDSLTERLTDLDERRDEDLLREALHTYEELQVRAGAMLANLRTATGSQKRVRCPPAAELGDEAEESALPVDEKESTGIRPRATRRSRVP